jgi:hypothetical protein
MHSTRWGRVNFLSLAVVVSALVILGFFIFKEPVINKPFVPPEFFEARARGVAISENIVRLSNESMNNLKEISAADEIMNYNGGLDLVLKEIARNNEARGEALKLSQELGVMAAKLVDIKPESAAKVGIQAIGNEYQIAQRLISYNNSIYQLLEVLQSRFTNKAESNDKTVVRVKDLIEKMNSDAEAINKLNSEYGVLMSEFDTLTR